MDDTLYVLLFMTLVGYTESLECYTCSNLAYIAECNVTKKLCSAGQSCYHNMTAGLQSSGCVDNKKCDSHAAGPSIIGRGLVSRKTSSCFECCSTDQCNSALCYHPDPKACIDDESVNCAGLSSILNVCNDPRTIRWCTKFCGLCMVDGNWTLWSTWSQCDVTCENGHQTRTRTCTDPAPQMGGLDCVGDGVMTKPCKIEQTCPDAGWSAWTSWSICSVICGSGISFKTRSCTNPPPSPNGQYCVGSNSMEKSCVNHCENHCSSSSCQHGQCLNYPNRFECSCDYPYYGRTCENRANISCYDIFKNNNSAKTGVYNITLWNFFETIEVYCDMDTFPFGWTVIQHRFDGSVDFNRNHTEYVNGFGKVDGEFWLGLRYIQQMASWSGIVLRIVLTSANNSHVYEEFENFKLSSYPAFTLHLGNVTVEQVPGNHNGLIYNNGHDFTTYDNDVDAWPTGNCARLNKAGWWYNDCGYANLNGEYGNPPGSVNSLNNGSAGFIYYTWQQYHTLKASKLMLRRKYQ